MRTVRILLHSLVLTWISILAIMVGYGMVKVIHAHDQVRFQAPVAAIISVGGFALWSWLVRRLKRPAYILEFGMDYLVAFLVAFLWVPVIFIPLHYVSQGYLTSFSNITAIWMFQGPVHALALFTAMLIWRCFPQLKVR